MPRELVTIHVGQCGNQLGRRFWERLYKENDDSAPFSSAFFRDDGRKLRARSILVDMEQGPVFESLKGPFGELFEQKQTITDVSGAGNNFAYGHYVYGDQYAQPLMDLVQREVEMCDSLQSFFICHSLGGGTGSGLGSRLISLLEDEFPSVYRFTASVFPSADDDVITSPYNSLFALHHLTEHADCVFPLDNAALTRMAMDKYTQTKEEDKPVDKGFDLMNDVAAQMMSNLTCSVRFPGEMNVDLNEICTNMVPFPRMHYLATSVATDERPSASGNAAAHSTNSAPTSSVITTPGRRRKASRHAQTTSHAVIARAFHEVVSRDKQLADVDPRSGVCAAMAVLGRGTSLSVADFTANAAAVHRHTAMVPWNCDGLKVGVCSVGPLGGSYALLGVANTSAFVPVLARMHERFHRLYSRRAMLHHYLQYMEEEQVRAAEESLRDLMLTYEALRVHTGTSFHECEGRGTGSHTEAGQTERIRQRVPLPAF